MRYSVILLLLASLTTSCCSPLSMLGITDAPYVLTAKKVWLLTDVAGGTCSAFPVFCDWDPLAEKYRILFLTAKHCVDDESDEGPYTLKNCSGVELQSARRLLLHPEDDLGLVVVLSDTSLSCVSYTSSNPTLGDTIYVAGWPAGRHLHLTSGLMSSIANCGSAQVYFGNSGGVVMNSAGQVVGLVSGMGGSNRYGPISHMMYYVPLTDARIQWMENFRDLLVSSP